MAISWWRKWRAKVETDNAGRQSFGRGSFFRGQCCLPDDLPIPAWHYEVLAERERPIREGKAKFLDFEEVCKELRKAVQ